MQGVALRVLAGPLLGGWGSTFGVSGLHAHASQGESAGSPGGGGAGNETPSVSLGARDVKGGGRGPSAIGPP